MNEEELYEFTRSKWKINPERAKKAQYAFTIYKGEIVEVYEIISWNPAASLPVLPSYQEEAKSYLKSGLPDRFEFTGRLAPEEIKKQYVGHSVKHYYKKGSANPITYVNVN